MPKKYSWTLLNLVFLWRLSKDIAILGSSNRVMSPVDVVNPSTTQARLTAGAGVARHTSQDVTGGHRSPYPAVHIRCGVD